MTQSQTEVTFEVWQREANGRDNALLSPDLTKQAALTLRDQLNANAQAAQTGLTFHVVKVTTTRTVVAE